MLPTRRTLVYLALASLLFGPITLFGGNMQNSVVDLSAAIIEDHSLRIDPYHTNSPDTALRDGHYYSGMAPGTSILAMPCYFAAKAFWAAAPAQLYQALDRQKAKSPGDRYSLLHTPHYKEQILTHA